MEVKTDMNQFFMLTKVYVKRLQLVKSSKTLKLKFPSLLLLNQNHLGQNIENVHYKEFCISYFTGSFMPN